LIVVLLVILAGVGGYYAYRFSRSMKPRNRIGVLKLNFDEPVVEQSEPSPFDLALHEDVTPLFDMLRAIDRPRTTRLKGIVARFGNDQPSMTQAQEIRAALARFRASGKFTYAFGASYGDFGSSNRSYYLASASKILVATDRLGGPAGAGNRDAFRQERFG